MNCKLQNLTIYHTFIVFHFSGFTSSIGTIQKPVNGFKSTLLTKAEAVSCCYITFNRSFGSAHVSFDFEGLITCYGSS